MADIPSELEEIVESRWIQTGDVWFSAVGDQTIGVLPVADSGSGDVARRVRREIRQAGWAHDVDGIDFEEITVLGGDNVDPVRDSVIKLTTRQASRKPRDAAQTAEPGNRVSIRVGDERRNGRLVNTDELEIGDEIYVEYGERRDTGGYRYKAHGQSFTDVVADRDGGSLITSRMITIEEGQVPVPIDMEDDRSLDARYVVRLN